MQAESAEHLQGGNAIIAGDDADVCSVSYSLDIQEPLELCIDVTVRHGLFCLP